jgi:predicted alpha/beta-hydrolase family hydrolase
MADTPAIAEEGFTSGEPPVSALRYPAATGVPATAVTVVLAHGAGAGMAHPFMLACARGLAARGCDAVTFNFPYMERRAQTGKASAPNPAPQLEACYRALIATLAERGWLDGRRLVIGGKSMGGRMATMVAAGADAGTGPVAHAIAGVVALGYPLHPPGRPQQLRVAHLATLRTPTIFVQGTRDAFGAPADIRDATAATPGPVTIVGIDGGDHSFAVRGTPARQVLDGLGETVASWIAGV